MKISRLITICLLTISMAACQPGTKEILSAGRLAAIPRSATDLMLAGTDNLFSSKHYIKFKADPKDIEEFIQNSASIRSIKPEAFDSGHQYVPFPKDADTATFDDRHEYFSIDKRWPWFDPTIKVRGRKYTIDQDHDANGGEVVVDDEKNIVYITVYHS